MVSKPDFAQKMVGWYDPQQLFRTGGLVLISTQFAFHADNREIQALASLARRQFDHGPGPVTPPAASVRDYSTDPDMGRDLWIDFVADTGDGFNSTYAVASELARTTIPAEMPGGQTVDTERGKLLILGGDLVYPTPTGQGYDDRLLGPYKAAFGTDHAPEVWALPGNHDWYDSLSVFRRLFCTREDYGPWRSNQRLSYFATRLPHGWWLFGVDLQLQHEIDQQQLWYFQSVLETIGQQDRIILCCPEPYWVDQAVRAVGSSDLVTPLFERLRDEMGDRLQLVVAGDLHHYQRITKPGQHLITCGTGGAFLHPTHVVNLSPPAGFSLEKSYPDVERSRKLTCRNAFFLFRNPVFGVVPAFFYMLVAWLTGINIGEEFHKIELPELGEMGLSRIWEALHVGVQSAILSPGGMTAYIVIFAGFIVFTQSRSKRFAWFAGILHAFSHAVVGFFIFWGAAYYSITVWNLDPKSIEQYLLAAVVIGVGAWIAGSILMGLYLWISLNVFREHTTEAFSSLRIQDWKGFLRMHLCANGDLEVFFFGIRRVPRAWRKKTQGMSGPEWISNDTRATPATLEDYVKITR
jgi:Calcineurin-like phosphoesterase